MTTVPGSGLFITFEGIDGAGKSSHIENVAAALAASGREVVQTREPGGTPLAEALRILVLERPMDPLTEALLVFAARRDHLAQTIRPALARGAAVLCDRFTDSTFAYQGYGRGFDRAILTQLELWVQQELRPDLTLWFDVPPAEAARRLQAARRPDRFEREDEAFFSRVAAGYAARAQAEPDRIVRIDASVDLPSVAQQVRSTFESRGWL